MNISFTDFWGDFQNNSNFFIDVIRDIYPHARVVPFSNDTDILVYSCFGNTHHYANRTKTKKIYYTGENIRPNFNECDCSLTFDYYQGKNFRLPLWMLQIDWFNKITYVNPQFVLPVNSINDNNFINNDKTKFCCAVFNTDSPYRFETVNKLSTYKKVDCFGKPHGNWFYGEDIKYKTLSNYKFNICFENTLYPGYFTEKLFHAKTAGTVPIYWADKSLSQDFNTKAFINLYDFNNDVDKLIKYIKIVDQDDELYSSYKKEPLFTLEPSLDNLKSFLKNII